MQHIIALTEAQEATLEQIAEEAGKTPDEVIEEQVSFYLKQMLDREADRVGIDHQLDGLSDADKAELTAILINDKDKFIKAKKG